jgi:4-alpha-glucanotransferase
MSLRSSGILLHPSSLPSPFGIGDLGPPAHRFADFLAASGQRLWQLLPLNPTDAGHGHSPYYSPSAFAGNPLLISPEALVEQGLLEVSEIRLAGKPPAGRVAFDEALRCKRHLLQLAGRRFASAGAPTAYTLFCRRSGWLDDFVLYIVLRDYYHGRPWFEWPHSLRDRQPAALQEARETFGDRIRFEKIVQYLFFRQWFALKRYCNGRQIRMIGDLPIYVPLDSADVWAHPHFFKLDAQGRPTALSGVPPDYFSATGQLWGHPVYDWQALQQQGYGWWIDRMRHHLWLYDLTRIDHFRGLVAYWEVPASADTAVDGRWVDVPVEDLFDRLIIHLGTLPVIVEDLGTITADVREVIRHYGFPGMRVLLFAFGDDFPNSSFLLHHHEKNCVVYTGTHDNNTTRGWWSEEAGPMEKRNLVRYLGREVAAEELPWELIRLAMMSSAEKAVIPLQDVLQLGAEARMNRPSRDTGNWLWRFEWRALGTHVADRLRDMTVSYGR